MTIEAVKQDIEKRVKEGSFEHVLKFDCGSDGVLIINKNEVSTEDQEAECTVGVTLDDLKAMTAGTLNPTMGFMQGKLKVDGNMGVAMKLGQLL